MKAIGKIAVVAMMLSLAFVLTACGGSASSSAASSSASASSASASASASSASASASASASSASSAAADADTYENEFFGINFDLPKGWSFMEESAVAGIGDIITATSKNSELDMVAMSADQSQIVMVGIDAPSSENAGMTAEQYLEAQQTQMTAALEGTYAFTSTSATVSFQGLDRELPAAVMNLDVDGVKLCMVQAVAEKEGYFFNAIAIASSESEAVSAFENFTATIQ